MTAPATSVSSSGAVHPTPVASAYPGAIRTENLVKIYGERHVVDGVSLTVQPGEVVGLIGPNGAGKTTTFYMVVGLVPATRGRVFFGERDITHLRMHERARLGLGYLAQEPSTFRQLTVAENILAILEAIGVPRRERASRVEAHLAELHLTHVAKQKAYTLSGGERRRLEVARALVTRPQFLLLDEPFAAIDPISVAEVQKIVRDLRARGIGILITDHSVRETLAVVDRAYLIHQGRVLTQGSSDFLLHDASAREVYLGKDFTL